MTSSAPRYFPRAPRYVFRPVDQRLMRFKGAGKNTSTAIALIRDLSTSGLSFAVSGDDPPQEGEMLKVEFTLPSTGSKKEPRQIAWFATVVRIEKPNPFTPNDGATIVASRFHRLPDAVTREMKKCLDAKVGTEETVDYDLGQPTIRELLVFFSLVTGSTAAFVVMALPITFWLAPFHGLFKS